MRFLQIITTPGMSGPPDPEHMARMNALMKEAIANGYLAATGGIGKRTTAAARVVKQGGEISVQDPPTESDNTWMAGGGFGLGDFASKDDAIANAKAILDTMGQDGFVELIAVSPLYPPPAEAGHPIPGVVPYISLPDAAGAIEFYKKAFGAREVSRMPAEDGKRVMHCQLVINGGAFMVSDVFPEYGYGHQPSSSFTMALVIADGQFWWDRALAAGCTQSMPFNTAPWGDRYGEQRDPFGVRWAFNQPAGRA